ncbi:MAG: hypothetical protein J4F39_08355 [Candidatus Latescibacteria bacterium]|nr:hypothetical protein [Candidatus Latescibacterota bacterium]
MAGIAFGPTVTAFNQSMLSVDIPWISGDVREKSVMSFVKIVGEMNRDTKRHTAFLQNIYNEAIKNPDRLKHLMPFRDIDASVEYLETLEEMLKKSLRNFARLHNSAGPETDDRKVDALSTLIGSIKTMIGTCQDLRWQVMIHEAQNEPASENVCESPEEFLKKLWE